jgi:hypothetical protein
MFVPPDEYLSLPLRAHELLRGVPLHDVSAVDLPGGGPGRTLADIRALEASTRPSQVVRALFGLRLLLGRLFGWDRKALAPGESLVSRLSPEERSASDPVPGTPVGPFLLVYEFPDERLLEIRNATVHGWVCTALVPRGSGYRFYFGVYVRPVSWITRPYLAAIEPFRRILYPAMLGRIRREWVARFAKTAAP